MAFISNVLLPAKRRFFGKASSSPPQDNIPLSQLDAVPLLQDSVGDGGQTSQGSSRAQSVTRSDDNAEKRPRNRSPFFCYLLHVILVALHVTLLLIAASNHAEHRITLPFDDEAFTTRLSGVLQAFYILYTALLVFVTQSLVLSAIFSGPKKVTQIHDICGAWSGLGAALSTLWSQTKVTSSVWSVVLVTAYFICISVLHVASSTIMQFQLFNHTITTTVPALVTWPGPSVNFSALNWNAAVGTLPFLQNLYGNTTNGLANNTLYDIPSQSFVGATVNATTVNADCGLVSNLSVISALPNPEGYGYSSMWINASITDVYPFVMQISKPPLLNEAWFGQLCQSVVSSSPCENYIIFLVSAALESDPSVNDIDHVDFNGSYTSGSNTPWQNASTPMYFVACALNATTTIATLDSSSNQPMLLNSDKDPTDVAWSNFSPNGDTNLTIAMSAAMQSYQLGSILKSTYCLPTMMIGIWYQIHSFEAYVNSLLGMGQTFCNATVPGEAQYASGAPLEYYTGTPSLLTKGQMESAVSQIAAQFIWLAGQLGSAGGGFDRETAKSEITQYVLQWQLNINPLAVIVALCASVVLFVLVVLMLWGRSSTPGVLSTAGVLEIMWLGSCPQSQVLRGHLRDEQNPSVDSLRALSMFETVFRTRSARAHAHKEDSKLYPAVLLDDLGTHATGSSSGLPESQECASGRTLRMSVFDQRPKPIHAPDTSRSRFWCYALHFTLVAAHVVLLVLLGYHPEHSVIIPIETNILITGLSAFLQAIYTLYSALLVVITQRLSLFRIVGNRRKLTTVHDISGAWTGIGAAVSVLWQQHSVVSSIWGITTVVTYLASMLVLHISASSIIQWQVFNHTLVDNLTSDLAFPSSAVNASQLGWSEIFPVLQTISLDTDVSTYGLSNSTLYDTPHVPASSSFLEVSVNATTLKAQCGLVPNLTMTPSTGLPLSYYLNFSLGGGDNASFAVDTTWNNFVLLVPDYRHPQCAACPQTIFFVITTELDVDDSVRDSVTVNLNWTYVTSGGSPQNPTISTHVAACSIGAETVPAMLNLQDDQVVSNTNQTASSNSTTWSTWSPADATNFSVGVATAITSLPDIISSTVVNQPNGSYFIYTDFDAYIMNLVGIDVASVVTAAGSNSSANSTLLTPAQLEDAVAQTTAKLLWISGRLGENPGGFQRSVGESRATTNVLQWRLNLSAIPIIFASLASFTALILVPFLIGKKPSKQHFQLVSGTSVLECLWLEAHSEMLHSRLSTIEVPRLDRLRAAGMFDVSLGDIGRSEFLSESME